MASPHSDLPIINLDDLPRKSLREKYGALYYLGLAGLAILVLLIVSFAVGVWTLRGTLANVYRLHDPGKTDAERVAAAYALSRDPHMTQRQYWDICLQKALPALPRYLMAESLTWEAMASDPEAYAESVAYSEGWPDWLRLLLVRPMAYGAGDGISVPRKPLEDLGRHADPMIRPWALYTRAVALYDAEAGKDLARAAADPGPPGELAGMLLAALRAKDPERTQLLDRATRWLRAHHPQAREIWDGWEDRGDRLVPGPASKLPQ